MRPESNAIRLLSSTRAMAKMHEFKVAPQDYISLPRDPAELFSLAIGLLGDSAAALADQVVDGLKPDSQAFSTTTAPHLEADSARRDQLRFASLFFDAYLNSKLDVTITSEFSLLCAAAYYLNGSVGSAAVILRHMAEPDAGMASGLGLIVYKILRHDFDASIVYSHLADVARPVLHSVRAYLRFEADAITVLQAANALRARCYKVGTPREVLYGDLISALCLEKLRNSSRTLLPIASGLEPSVWRPVISKTRFPAELWPAQQRIATAGLLRGRSAVVQMPTSAGKTRAAELIIRAAFLSGRADLAVVVAPYKSLCHDIRRDLAFAFSGEPILLDEVSDSYQFDIFVDDLIKQQSVLILTPEKLLYILRRAPEFSEKIGLVIYDEGHQFDGMTRGPTYELLLTSLRIALPKHTQVILISAVIGNASEVAGWLISDSSAVVDGAGLLPTAKSIAFASWQDQRGRLEYVSPENPEDTEFFVPRVIAATPLSSRPKERKRRQFPERDGGDVGLFLGLHLVSNGSVAIFCGLKESVVKLCRRVEEIYDRGLSLARPASVSSNEEVRKLCDLSIMHLGETSAAARAAAIGVFAHHAATPHGLRLAIEHAMKYEQAKFVICTSTLAQGVNFPLRYLIVTTTQQGGEAISVRDFHNLIGRAGRAGMYTEGSVIFSSPDIYAQRRETNPWNRRAWVGAKHLLDRRNSEPCRSALLDLFAPYEQRLSPAERRLPRRQRPAPVSQEMRPEWLNLAFADRAVLETIAAQAVALQPRVRKDEFLRFLQGRARAVQSIAAYLAAHMTFEEPDAEDRLSELVQSTLAYHLADDAVRSRLLTTFKSIMEALIENAGADLRLLIRRSPLPPILVSELNAWLASNRAQLRLAMANGALLQAVTGIILTCNSSKILRSLSESSILPDALASWIAGVPFEKIHSALLARDVRVGRDKITVEHVVELCEGGFGYDLAMSVATLTDLLEGSDDELYEAMGFLQRQVKVGLPTRAAVAFYEAGFADRVVAAALSGQWLEAADRQRVRAVCRAETDRVRATLSPYPSYFTYVLEELAR